MRNSLYKSIKYLVLVGLFFNLETLPLSAQDDDVSLDMEFRFKTYKNADKTRSFIVEFYGTMEKERVPVYDAEIRFFNSTEDEEVLIGTANTTQEGISNLTLPADYSYIKDEEGYINVTARFEGSGDLDSFEESLAVRDLNLTLELNESEDGNTITVYANMIDNLGEEIPIEESDIYFYVQGMVSRLPIGDDWLEEGEYIFDFPNDIPGDKNGTLLVYVEIEDNDDFGNVTQTATVNWGTGPRLESGKVRMLWSDFGPIWMIVLMSTLLIAVWANIIHSIYNLVRINQEGKELKETT